MKTILDWNAFNKSGQIVLSTASLSMISALIRGLEVGAVSSIENGIEAFASPSIPSHCFITYIKSDLIRGLEFTLPKNQEESIIPEGGINIVELGEFNANILMNHIVMVARPPFLDQYEDEAVAWLKTMEKRNKDKYGILNLFAYLGIGSNQPGQEVCAQFTARFLIDMLNIINKHPNPNIYALPNKWILENKSSPYDQMVWFKEQHWDIPFTKTVSSEYNPQEEIRAPEDI